MSDALRIPDRVLVEHLLDGDPEAADLFVARFSKLVWATLARTGLSGAAAEDVFQDVFMRLWEDDYRRLRLWSGDDNFAAYLVPVVRHRALDYFRAASPEHENPLPDSGESGTPTDRDPDPEELASIEQQKQSVERAVAHLSGIDRELYRLRYVESESYAGIASALGITVNNVGVRLHRLEQKLRRAVQDPEAGIMASGVRSTGLRPSLE